MGLHTAGCGNDAPSNSDTSPSGGADDDDLMESDEEEPVDDDDQPASRDARAGSGADDGAKPGADGGAKPGAEGGSKPGGDGGKDDGEAAVGAPPAPHEGGEPFGEWTYYEVPGAVCREGGPAGYYIRRGDNSDKNLMIFLNGGGVCFDDFFCGINPPDVNSSLPGETLLAASLDIVAGALVPERQQPTDNGIFKRDPANPVSDWNMIYVPYCTGDVYGGTKADAPVPRAAALGPQQFVGYNNVGLFLEHFGPEFKGRSQKVLLTGSSAGGFGTLLNMNRVQDFFGEGTLAYAVTDSGVNFRDEFLEPCLQKEWRELWGLDGALPKDCSGCFDPSGGGLSQGLGDFLLTKFKDRKVGGGIISTKQDEVIKLFFSAGLDNCASEPLLEVVPAALGLGSYPEERYPAGLKDFVENVTGREKFGSYIMEGNLHQHLFRDRFYEDNGVGMTIADWLTKILNDEVAHVGPL